MYIPRYAILACGRYDVTKEIFSDHTRFVSSRGVGLTDFALEKPWRAPSIILEVDPPEHTKARRVMARVMSPGAVVRLRTISSAKPKNWSTGCLRVNATPSLISLKPTQSRFFLRPLACEKSTSANWSTMVQWSSMH